MIVTAIYKIGDKYVVGDDRNIYRLPYTTYRRSFSLRKLKPHRGGFFIDGEWKEKKDIAFEPIPKPYELINTNKLPF